MSIYFNTNFTMFNFISIFRKRKRRTQASSSSNQAGPTQEAHSLPLSFPSIRPELAQVAAEAQKPIQPSPSLLPSTRPESAQHTVTNGSCPTRIGRGRPTVRQRSLAGDGEGTHALATTPRTSPVRQRSLAGDGEGTHALATTPRTIQRKQLNEKKGWSMLSGGHGGPAEQRTAARRRTGRFRP
jgi:hypothetical protein